MDTAGRRAWERASAGSSAYTRAGPTIPPTQDSECNQVKYSTDLVLRNVDEKQSLGRAAADLKGGRRSCYAVGFDYWANCYDVICSCCSRIRGWISHKQTRIIWPSAQLACRTDCRPRRAWHQRSQQLLVSTSSRLLRHGAQNFYCPYSPFPGTFWGQYVAGHTNA